VVPRTNDERRSVLIEALAAQGLSLGAAAVIAHAYDLEAEALVLKGRRPRSMEWCSAWFEAVEAIADCAHDLARGGCTVALPDDLRRCALYRHWPAADTEVGMARVHPELRLFAVGLRTDAFGDVEVYGPESEDACIAWIEQRVGPLGGEGA